MWSDEDKKLLREYFNKIGSELWPFNQMDEDDEAALGSAFFGTVDDFQGTVGMLDEEGQ